MVELIYFNAGGGHRASSLALEAAIARARLPWEVRRTNLFEVLDPTARFRQWTGMDPEDLYNKRLASGWTLGLSKELRLLQGMIRCSHKTLVRRLQRHWREGAPDMVVSLVPNFNRALGDSLARALPGTPFVTVLTDLADCPPHFWIEPCVDQHLVCGSPRAVAQARAAGCREERIHATSGMLIGQGFYDVAAVDRPAERARLGLDAQRPVGLVLFGSEGSREMLAIARRLPHTPLILACGRNAALAQALRALPQGSAPRVVLDYTPQVARYMQLADFFIGKPGSGSLSEAVHMGLPPIVVRNAWTMPQEQYCTDWVRDNGLGLVLRSFAQVAGAVRTLEADLPRYQAAVRGLRNRAAFEAPAVLARILEEARAAAVPPLAVNQR